MKKFWIPPFAGMTIWAAKDMQRFLGLAIGLFSVIGFTSSAEAIPITVAEVQNGVAVVQGSKAATSAIRHHLGRPIRYFCESRRCCVLI